MTHGCSKPQREALFLGAHLFPPVFLPGRGRRVDVWRPVVQVPAEPPCQGDRADLALALGTGQPGR